MGFITDLSGTQTILTYYHFKGDDGCDRCTALEGYYLNYPSRPHPNCNCEIEEEFVLAPDYTIEYRNLRRIEGADYEVIHSGVAEHTNATAASVRVTFYVQDAMEGSIQVSQEIDQVFQVSTAYAGDSKKTVAHAYNAEVGPGEHVSINVVWTLHWIELTAERWLLVRGADGETLEVLDVEIEDQIELIAGYRLEATESG